MRLTTKSRYGLRILLDIATNEGQGMVRAKDITFRLGLTIKYVESLARQPEAEKVLTRTLFIGLAMIESLAIYCLVIVLIVLFRNPLLEYLLK